MVGCNSDDHIHRIILKYRDNKDASVAQVTAAHGGTSNDMISQVLDLDADEFIAKVIASEYKAKTGKFIHHMRTRVGMIEITTNKGRQVTCGSFDRTKGESVYYFCCIWLMQGRQVSRMVL